MKINKNTTIAVVLILAAIITRIVSAEFAIWNFASLGAIALFSGAVLKNKNLAFTLPLVALFISDVVLEIISGNGFYDISQFFVYGAFALIILLGTLMKNKKVLTVFGFSIASSIVFFIISNFGVWMTSFYPGAFGAIYPPTFDGLVSCYVMAVPFLKNTLISDVVFSGLIFGAYYWWQSVSLSKRAVIQ